ncbi:glycerophosphodiester phosphodiesterase family protein [Streptomyces sp. JJ38]|uniref:glycerophosphodiester phosphodiesterase family protein n=1 Tax=Streptomyces sp. JJ38 TaxID=2738128 RepID=UPI0027E08B94|nr:glycerophosphodiester phosphodiesterase family protein [Streptomyces sp. JJ38]
MSLRPIALTGPLLGVLALVLAMAPAPVGPPDAGPRERPAPVASPSAVPQKLPTPSEAEPEGSADVLAIAHRGASAYAPENTLAAADKARELGVEWVENDVQRTRDGELVVMHDATLARTTNVEEVFPDRAPWRVRDFTAAEIARLDAGSWFDARYTGEPVPTLERLLERMTVNHQKLLLEIKKPDLYPGIEQDILDELRDEGWLSPYHVRRRLVVQTFDADSLRRVHALNPAVRTGFLGTPEVAELPEYGTFADQVNPRYTTVTPEYVAAVHSVLGAHGRPLEVFTWTVDDGPTAARLAGAGVDGVISNRPDVVREAIERGERDHERDDAWGGAGR